MAVKSHDWQLAVVSLHNGKCQFVLHFRGNGKSSYSFSIMTGLGEWYIPKGLNVRAKH